MQFPLNNSSNIPPSGGNDTLPGFYGVSEVFSAISVVDSADFNIWGKVGFPMLPQYTFDVNVHWLYR